MKKIFALILSVLMLVSLTACAGTEKPSDNQNDSNVSTDDKNDADNKDEGTSLEGVSAPVDILTTVWNSYGDDEKFYAGGGAGEGMVENAPGTVDVTDTDSLQATLICGSDAAAMIDGAASLFHGMIANNFTVGAYHIKDSADRTAFESAMQTAIKGNQWMCGMPEKLLIANITDDYVVVAYGLSDIVDTFKTKLTAAYDMTEITVEEALA